jgi:DeoR family glycerol-3-phosphate regulon repressor
MSTKNTKNYQLCCFMIRPSTAYVAMALQNHRELFVVTNSVSVAHSLATRNSNRVVLAGGELRSHDGGSFGTQGIDFISQFNIRYAVLSAGAISESTGFMLHDLQEAEVSRAAMARASTTIVVSDSSKFGISAPITLTRPDDIDILVTERPPHNAITRLLRASDVDVVISGLSHN